MLNDKSGVRVPGHDKNVLGQIDKSDAMEQVHDSFVAADDKREQEQLEWHQFSSQFQLESN